MNALPCNLLCLADRAQWQRLGDGFRKHATTIERSDILAGLAILIGFAIGVLILSRLAARAEKRRALYSPRALFRQLCDAHGVDRTGRRLLMFVARAQMLADPNRLFIEPDRLDVSLLPQEWQSHRAELAALRVRLGGDRRDAAHRSADEGQDAGQ
jgi:hypothetical protein